MRAHTGSFKLKVDLYWLVSIIILLIVLALSVRYCDLHDYYAYHFAYNTNYLYWVIEPGYSLLGQFFYKYNAPYYVYYGFLISVTIILIWRFYQKYGKHPVLLLMVFTIYPYINFLQQLRGAFAASLILTALSFLDKDKPSYVKFILTVFVAMFFHATAISYLLFIFAVKLSYKKLRKVTFGVFIFALPLIAFARYLMFNIFPYFTYFQDKYTRYLIDDTFASLSAILDWLIFFTIFLLLQWIIGNSFNTFSQPTQFFIKITYIVFMLSLLRGLGNNGYRIALLMYPAFYVALSNIAYEVRVKLKRKVTFAILFGFAVTSLLIWWGPLFPRMYEIVTTEMWQVWDYYY